MSTDYGVEFAIHNRKVAALRNEIDMWDTAHIASTRLGTFNQPRRIKHIKIGDIVSLYARRKEWANLQD
jgi:hypothetical protein